MVSDSSGVRIVFSSGPSSDLNSHVVVDPDPIVSIGQLDGPDEYTLFKITDAVLLKDEAIAVSEKASNTLRLYDAQGTHIKTFGGTGGGPGEFQVLHRVFAYRSDSVVGFEGGFGAHIAVFGPDGGVGTTRFLMAPSEAYPYPSVVGVAPTVGPLVRAFERMPPRPENGGLFTSTISVWQYDFDWQPLGMVGEFAGPPRYGENENQGFAMSTIFDESAGDLISVNPYDFSWRIWSTTGELIQVSSRPVERVGVTQEFVERDLELKRQRWINIFADEDGELPPRWANFVADRTENVPYPDSLPLVGGIKTTESGLVWLEHYRPFSDEDGPAIYSVYFRDGQWLNDLQVPPGFKVFDIGNDRILGMVKDELDIEYIQVLRYLPGTLSDHAR